MAISHVHTDRTADIASTAATTTITLPTGVASTDVVVVVFGTDKGSLTTTGTVTAPSGWTRVGARVAATGGNNAISLDVFVALGNVANLDFTNGTTTIQQGWVCAAFSGVDTTTPVDAAGTGNSGTASATLTVNAVTVATNQAWELVGCCSWLGAAGEFSATGFTFSENGASNASAALGWNTTPKGTGSTGTFTLTDSTGGTSQILCAQPFALRPAAGAADVLMGQACL